MKIMKEMTKAEALDLIQVIRTDIARNFLYQGETNDENGEPITWANIQDMKTRLNGDICDLEEYQSGMGGNNIEAHVEIEGEWFFLKTAWSNFGYEIFEAEDGRFFIVYDGAWNGLQAQNVLPKPLATFAWTDSKIESSLSEGVVSWDEYKEIRKEKGLDG